MKDRHRDREVLIEAAATAYRERDADGRILASPAWHDLAPADREEAFERQLLARRLERALDQDGLTSTARVVLARVQRFR